jgi:hypothetical protein
MTLSEAAEDLGVGATALKDLCRARNIKPWPGKVHRSLTELIQEVEAFQPDQALQGSRDEVLQDLR